jgi:hypothetical protein
MQKKPRLPRTRLPIGCQTAVRKSKRQNPKIRRVKTQNQSRLTRQREMTPRVPVSIAEQHFAIQPIADATKGKFTK